MLLLYYCNYQYEHIYCKHKYNYSCCCCSATSCVIVKPTADDTATTNATFVEIMFYDWLM